MHINTGIVPGFISDHQPFQFEYSSKISKNLTRKILTEICNTHRSPSCGLSNISSTTAEGPVSMAAQIILAISSASISLS